MSTPPSEPEILEKVAAAVAEQKGIDACEVRIDSTFESLGMDSLDAFEIIFELEDALDVDIPDGPARAMRNVQDVVDGLGKLVRGEELTVPEPPATDAEDGVSAEDGAPAEDGASAGDGAPAVEQDRPDVAG